MTNKEVKHLLRLLIEKEREANKDRENSQKLLHECDQSETALEGTFKCQNKN